MLREAFGAGTSHPAKLSFSERLVVIGVDCVAREGVDLHVDCHRLVL